MWGRLMLASETCSERVIIEQTGTQSQECKGQISPTGGEGRMQISEQISFEIEGTDLESPESVVRGGRGSLRKPHFVERGWQFHHIPRF